MCDEANMQWRDTSAGCPGPAVYLDEQLGLFQATLFVLFAQRLH